MSPKSDHPNRRANGSSPPGRMGSGAPGSAVSVPPSTDEIDSEWGSPKTNDTQSGGARAAPKTSKGTLSGVSPLEAKSSQTPSSSKGVDGSSSPSAPTPAKPVEARPSAPPKSATPRREVRAVANVAPAPSAERPRGGASLYLMGAAVVAAIGLWFAVRSSRSEPTSPATAVVPPAAEPLVSASPPPAPTASAVLEDPKGPESPAASAVAAPAASAAAAAEGEGSETIAVLINIRPEGTTIFFKGKQVGKSPLTVEVPRGERRVFEAVNPGYVTRKVVVDGSRSEISFGMKLEEQE